MATPAYTHFDRLSPATTQDGTDAMTSARENMQALVDQIVTRQSRWSYAGFGGTPERPQFFLWSNPDTVAPSQVESLWTRNTWNTDGTLRRMEYFYSLTTALFFLDAVPVGYVDYNYLGSGVLKNSVWTEGAAP